MAASYWIDDSTVATSDWQTVTANTYTVNYDLVIGGGSTISPSPKKPATNMEWLDNRVEEMRVKL